MSKQKAYAVKVINVFSEIVTVYAEDEASAREAAKVVIETPDRDAVNVYEQTLPDEHWAVITQAAYDELVADFERMAEEMGTEKNDPRTISGFNPRVVQ